MKQTAVEWLEQQIKEYSLIKPSLVSGFSILIEQAKEMEKQQQGFSDVDVELIANEMVNWAIDNIGNPNPESGKKFDEVLNKHKNVIG